MMSLDSQPNMMEVGSLKSYGIDIEALDRKMRNYSAGNIKHYFHKWRNITSDKHILSIVQDGLMLNFTGDPPQKEAFEYPRSNAEFELINAEVQALLKKGLISESNIDEGDYYSNLFTTPKKDGSYRTILNLKFLNKECDTKHFKMESLKQAVHMVRPGAYLASIDIKDAFYTVPIHPDHKKYLKFMWSARAHQFDAMPNGYKDAMRVFTKLMKPVFSNLREKGYMSIIYVDDSLLYGDTFEECLENVIITLESLQELGFIIHSKKSVLIPTQIIEFLGFIINTQNMTLTLTPKKKLKIMDKARKLLSGRISIRMVASFVGNLTSSFEAVPMGRLHYRHIELSKTLSLKKQRGDFDAPCILSDKARQEIKWWLHNVEGAFAKIKSIPNVDYTIHTDASNLGWGACDEIFVSNGRWSEEEKDMHINCLELLAVKFALKSYLPLQRNTRHIRIMSDNTTAISYINRQGGSHNMSLNDISVDIWSLCSQYDIHISAAHIPGKHNVLADLASREFHDAAEWMLSPKVFQNIIRKWGEPDIDLFASRLNHQVPTYASWKPDPESSVIDAMQITWGNKFVYIFPPFSMIWPVLSKLERDRVERAILIIPWWPTQSWLPRIMRKAIDEMTISSRDLSLPGTTMTHPMAPGLKLRAVLCSWRDKCQHRR